jgi:hypothetical protein
MLVVAGKNTAQCLDCEEQYSLDQVATEPAALD